ncbi:MAG: hypothetical protein Q4P34_00460 [Tissierellia bacterium]|nr:hypothetical protein [Tissierellia bacterium]
MNKRYVIVLLIFLILLSNISFASELNEIQMPKALEDQSWVEVYRQILNSERPYRHEYLTDYTSAKYISDSEPMWPVSYSLVDSPDFDYPILHLESPGAADLPPIVALVSYLGNGETGNLGMIAQTERSQNSHLYKSANDGSLYFTQGEAYDDRISNYIFKISNVDGFPLINYCYGQNYKGFATAHHYAGPEKGYTEELLNTSNPNHSSDKGANHLTGTFIVDASKEPNTLEDYENLLNSLEIIYPEEISKEEFNNYANNYIDNLQRQYDEKQAIIIEENRKIEEEKKKIEEEKLKKEEEEKKKIEEERKADKKRIQEENKKALKSISGRYDFSFNKDKEIKNEDFFKFLNMVKDFFNQDDLVDYKEILYEFKKEVSKVSPYLLSYIEDYENSKWSGSCYGISSMAKLMKDGFDFKSYSSLSSVPYPREDEDTKNIINTLQASYMILAPKEYENNKELLTELIDEFEAGNNYQVLSYYINNSDLSHSILAFGLEETDKMIGELKFSKKLKIKDPNNLDLSYIYITNDLENVVFVSSDDKTVYEDNPRLRSLVSNTLDSYFGALFSDDIKAASEDEKDIERDYSYKNINWIGDNKVYFITFRDNEISFENSKGDIVFIKYGRINGKNFGLKVKPVLEMEDKIQVELEKDDYIIKSQRPLVSTIVTKYSFVKIEDDDINRIDWNSDGSFEIQKEGQIDEYEDLISIGNEVSVQNTDEKVSLYSDSYNHLKGRISDDEVILNRDGGLGNSEIKSEKIGENSKDIAVVDLDEDLDTIKISSNDEGYLEIKNMRDEIIGKDKYKPEKSKESLFSTKNFKLFIFILAFLVLIIILVIIKKNKKKSKKK